MSNFLERIFSSVDAAERAAELERSHVRLQQEVAERKRAEQAVRETDERLNLALQAAGVGTWSWDLRSGRIVWDDYLHPLFGLAPGEFSGRPESFFEMLHPEDRGRVREEIRRAVEEGADYDTRFRAVWSCGTLHYLMARGKVYRDEAGQPVRMAGVCWDVTEQTLAANAVKDSQSLYASLVENLPVHVFRKDLSGRIIYANRLFCELLGRPESEVLGRTDYDFFPRELAEKYRNDDCRIVETGEVFEDFEENRVGGRTRYVHVLKTPVRDGHGRIIGTQAVFWDETSRIQAEHDLAYERHLLHTLLDNLPDAIYFKDRDSRFLRVSQALAARLGASDAAEVLGKSDADFFPADYAAQARRDEQELMRTGRILVGKEERPIWPDGSESWVLTTKSALRNPQGEVIGTFGISRDITELKQAEHALRQSEHRARLIVDTALDAFVSMDSEGTIVDWNPQAERTFGWPREEVLGRGLAETIIPHRYRQAHSVGLEQFLRTGEGTLLNRRVEITALHRDGREFPVELTISPLRYGGAYLFNAFVHDITARKAAEQAMQAAKEAAEAASRAKSDFLANMSHEIRTPMNAIMGMTELVLDTPLTAEQREYLTTVRESAEGLLSIINDVLDFSKIEAGKLTLEFARIDLRDAIGDTMKLLAPRAHRDNLELAYHVHPDVPDALIGDPSRLRQVLVNLVGNALKFTERGEVVLDVRCHAQTDTDVVLHFSVRDTGIGIPREKLKAIFEAFEQADTSSTRRFAGTGLGLTISSSLVELMGGEIWVESQVGVGSTFHFTAHFERAPEHPPALEEVHEARVRGTRVLVVDDNATNGRILAEMLRNWDMVPTVVRSAQEALAELRAAWRDNRPFSLVISDVNMPEVDGFTLAERVKDDEELSSTIIMMLTSGDRPGDVARCEELGAAAYLLKPIKQSELFDAIMVALGVHAAEDVPAQSVAGIIAQIPPLDILLAEDSLPNQKLAVGLLKKYGHRVTIANNGREALAAVDSKAFDLILMDVQMPEMDGLEATMAIRRREQHSDHRLPIIAMTAHAMKGDREKCLEAGMDDYVSKPVRTEQLFEAMRRVLAESRRQGDERAPEVAAGLINWPAALETVQGDEDLLRLVAEAFLEECPPLLGQLRTAIAAGECSVVRRAAHTIKGSLRTFAAEPAIALAARLEEMGRTESLSAALETFDSLAEKLDSIVAELGQFVSRSAGTSGG